MFLMLPCHAALFAATMNVYFSRYYFRRCCRHTICRHDCYAGDVAFLSLLSPRFHAALLMLLFFAAFAAYADFQMPSYFAFTSLPTLAVIDF